MEMQVENCCWHCFCSCGCIYNCGCSYYFCFNVIPYHFLFAVLLLSLFRWQRGRGRGRGVDCEGDEGGGEELPHGPVVPEEEASLPGGGQQLRPRVQQCRKVPARPGVQRIQSALPPLPLLQGGVSPGSYNSPAIVQKGEHFLNPNLNPSPSPNPLTSTLIITLTL